MGTMTLPASAPRHSKPGRLPGGLHYSWVIVGVLVVVQVIGSAISQSAGVMVAPLRDPRGDFGWGIGTIGALLALTQAICMVPLMASVSHWFRRRLGLGTGILWAAGGLGAALLAPVVGSLLDRLGWQGTFWSLGAVGGGIILSLTPFFRDRPADLGLLPYGASANDP